MDKEKESLKLTIGIFADKLAVYEEEVFNLKNTISELQYKNDALKNSIKYFKSNQHNNTSYIMSLIKFFGKDVLPNIKEMIEEIENQEDWE